ncbi:MAG: hypothetical protein Q8K96_12905 [Rubrivivax sp.]|nr:hypothetical protein [Rubrivivax sp.]
MAEAITLNLARWLIALLMLPQWAGAGTYGSNADNMESVRAQKARQTHAEAKAAEFKTRWPLGYNPFATVVSRPYTPLAPTSIAECNRYRDAYKEIIRDVSDHHWACIASTKPRSEPYSLEHVNAGFRNFGRTQPSVCSNPDCETLHKAMIDMTDSANAGNEKCMSAFYRYEKSAADKAARWKSKRE